MRLCDNIFLSPIGYFKCLDLTEFLEITRQFVEWPAIKVGNSESYLMQQCNHCFGTTVNCTCERLIEKKIRLFLVTQITRKILGPSETDVLRIVTVLFLSVQNSIVAHNSTAEKQRLTSQYPVLINFNLRGHLKHLKILKLGKKELRLPTDYYGVIFLGRTKEWGSSLGKSDLVQKCPPTANLKNKLQYEGYSVWKIGWLQWSLVCSRGYPQTLSLEKIFCKYWSDRFSRISRYYFKFTQRCNSKVLLIINQCACTPVSVVAQAIVFYNLVPNLVPSFSSSEWSLGSLHHWLPRIFKGSQTMHN